MITMVLCEYYFSSFLDTLRSANRILFLCLMWLCMGAPGSLYGNQPEQYFLSEKPAPKVHYVKKIPGVKAQSPHLHFTNFDTEDGLALSSIYASYVDNKGNIWFGSHGGGVSKYNGHQFSRITTQNGLPHNSILSISGDSKGNLWFGTYGGGAAKYDGRKFTPFTIENGLTHNVVFDLLVDKQDRVWLATYGGGLSIYEDGNFKHYTQEEGHLNSNVIFCLTEDSDGHLWIGTNGGVSRFDKKETFEHFNLPTANNSIRSIGIDKHNHKWFGTIGAGVSVFDGEEIKQLDLPSGFEESTIWHIIKDSKDNMWLGTNMGVLMYDGFRFHVITREQGLTHNSVRFISEDLKGNLWFSTFGGGVSRFNGNAVQIYTQQQGLNNSDIRAITQDSQGNLWFATNGFGANKYDGAYFYSYSQSIGLARDTVYTIFEDSNKNIWFGTNGGGVSVFDGEKFVNYTPEQGLIHTRILDITEDVYGNIWLASSRGVGRFDGESFTNYDTNSGLPHNFIRSVKSDSKGNIWMATYGGGVIKYNGEEFTSFNTDNGFPHNWVRSMWEDRNGYLWFGTYGAGLCRYDGESFLVFNRFQGMVDDVVYDIVEDENGIIWVGTNQGFSGLMFKTSSNEIISGGRVDKNNQELRAEYQAHWHHINNSTGYPVKNLNSNAMYISSLPLPSSYDAAVGLIWGGCGDNKVVRFNPNELRYSDKEPRVIFSQIKINDELVSWYSLDSSLDLSDTTDSLMIIQNESFVYGRELSPLERDSIRNYFSSLRFDGITSFEAIPQDLILPYRFNHITIHFNAIETGRKFLVNYQFMLKGQDTQWRPITQNTEVNYGNLREGSYTFLLKAQSPDGVWSEPITFSFRVRPPWWRTWPMFIVYFIITAFVLYGFVKWREKSLKTEKDLLEKTVRERTLELQQQKEAAEWQKSLVEEKNEEISQQKEQIFAQSQQLEKINQNLEERIASEVSQSRKKDVMLIQQSRQAAMGEMIGNIAHQWRQPLNAVAIIVQNLQEAYEFDEMNQQYLEAKVKQSMDIIQYMSQTIDDFRNFFKPEKSAHDFDVKHIVSRSISFVEATFKNNNIHLEANLDDNIVAHGYPNEYAQVILNLLNNAKDALLSKKLDSPAIWISLTKQDKQCVLKIRDNAGGINDAIAEKIFNPYFTTKAPGEGTGLGLYMSKTIIEKNMKGKLFFSNTDTGVEFTVCI